MCKTLVNEGKHEQKQIEGSRVGLVVCEEKEGRKQQGGHGHKYNCGTPVPVWLLRRGCRTSKEREREREFETDKDGERLSGSLD